MFIENIYISLPGRLWTTRRQVPQLNDTKLMSTTFQVRTTVSSVVDVSCLIISKQKLFEISFVWQNKVFLKNIYMMGYCYHLVSVVFYLLLWNHRVGVNQNLAVNLNGWSSIKFVNLLQIRNSIRVPGQNNAFLYWLIV